MCVHQHISIWIWNEYFYTNKMVDEKKMKMGIGENSTLRPRKSEYFTTSLKKDWRVESIRGLSSTSPLWFVCANLHVHVHARNTGLSYRVCISLSLATPFLREEEREV